MSVLALFAFSEASIAFRRRATHWSRDVLFPGAPVDVPSGKPALLRDAGIYHEGPDIMRRERLAIAYRSHWLL
ncbi:hypothetical protein PWG15_15365 [Ensifer adhaerens]|uniref:hypothetical protein n=1 Tax=Ensifer adhaerens TaxID=106592 RepID=UPI0023AA06E6|nr:hypothetical protein [Ensifer adhaerens]WDZ75978.1 hypothetical protein PWG15_15365 [Ensifer adhaerens]